jgi:hypothetical protein
VQRGLSFKQHFQDSVVERREGGRGRVDQLDFLEKELLDDSVERRVICGTERGGVGRAMGGGRVL